MSKKNLELVKKFFKGIREEGENIIMKCTINDHEEISYTGRTLNDNIKRLNGEDPHLLCKKCFPLTFINKKKELLNSKYFTEVIFTLPDTITYKCIKGHSSTLKMRSFEIKKSSKKELKKLCTHCSNEQYNNKLVNEIYKEYGHKIKDLHSDGECTFRCGNCFYERESSLSQLLRKKSMFCDLCVNKPSTFKDPSFVGALLFLKKEFEKKHESVEEIEIVFE